MPLHSSSVGTSLGPRASQLEPRWSMAYAAALDDARPVYLDTAARPDVLTHPLFPVCFEWPLQLELAGHAALGLTPAERVLGVHATHDLVLHRPLRANQRVHTRAEVVAVEQRSPGAYQLVRFETLDEDGRPLCTTHYGTLYRGVERVGSDRPCEPLAPPNTPPGAWREPVEIAVGAGAAHIYSECSRIWNPIHSDAAVARAAGLPGIILHGTATLGLAVSAIVARLADGDPSRVRRVHARFAGMVPLPSTLALFTAQSVTQGQGPGVCFEVRAATDGAPVIRDGWLGLGDASE